MAHIVISKWKAQYIPGEPVSQYFRYVEKSISTTVGGQILSNFDYIAYFCVIITRLNKALLTAAIAMLPQIHLIKK